MIMKRFLYYIWFLPLMLSGCEKDLMDYEGLEGVYFAVQWGDSWGNENSWPYQPYTDVNFILFRYFYSFIDKSMSVFDGYRSGESV